MKTYRTRTQHVEAVQWTGDNEGDVMDFFPFAQQVVWEGDSVVVHDKGAGYFTIERDAWVVRHPNGFLSIYGPDNFTAYYEPDDSPPEPEPPTLYIDTLKGGAMTDVSAYVNKLGWAEYFVNTVRAGTDQMILFRLPPDVAAARARGEVVRA